MPGEVTLGVGSPPLGLRLPAVLDQDDCRERSGTSAELDLVEIMINEEITVMCPWRRLASSPTSYKFGIFEELFSSWKGLHCQTVIFPRCFAIREQLFGKAEGQRGRLGNILHLDRINSTLLSHKVAILFSCE